MPALSSVLLTFSLQRTIGQYRTPDVAENLGTSLSGAQRTVQKKDFEFILTLNVETRHPVGDHSSVRFRYL